MMKLRYLFVAVTGCATSGTPADLPEIVPPVRAATPAGFGGSASARLLLDGAVSAADIRDRFFNPAGGPTEVFDILGSIDERIDEANSASATAPRPCLSQAPVAYTISVFGDDVPFAAQCFRSFGGSGFMQFGQVDGVTYLYVTGGATRLAARITDTVETWYGVGYTNDTCGGGFDGCSYAATHILAEPATSSFEMAVAGIGVGFCGVQLASDGVAIYAEGSTDMGATCNPVSTACVSAADLTDTTGCAATFTLPALGRHSGAGLHEFGESRYPDAPNITLDGTATDSLGFGPTEPTPGVGDFDAM
jgi:hypothetical protein